MPKLKTRKSIAKRLKQSASGKYMRLKTGSSHILTKKTAKRKSRLGKTVVVLDTEKNKLKNSLPYGLKR